MNLFGNLEGLQAVARRSLDNSEHRVSRCSGQSGLVTFQHLAHGLSGYPAYVNPVGPHVFQDIRRVKTLPVGTEHRTSVPYCQFTAAALEPHFSGGWLRFRCLRFLHDNSLFRNSGSFQDRLFPERADCRGNFSCTVGVRLFRRFVSGVVGVHMPGIPHKLSISLLYFPEPGKKILYRF